MCWLTIKYMQGDKLGLKLIHSDQNRDKKPQVFVVAEQNVFDALCKDLALDVYPVCFDYSSFVQASLTRSVSTNNAIILVSDSLSQKVVPLEAVVALVREKIILIPWQLQEDAVSKLMVNVSSRRPTLNTLRRSIFNHIGLEEPPARYDGDNTLDIPKPATIVELNNPEHIEAVKSKLENKDTALSRMHTMQEKMKVNKSIGALRVPDKSPLPVTDEDMIEMDTVFEPETPVAKSPVAESPLVEPVITEFESPIMEPVVPTVDAIIVEPMLVPEVSQIPEPIQKPAPENNIVKDDYIAFKSDAKITLPESEYRLPAKPSFMINEEDDDVKLEMPEVEQKDTFDSTFNANNNKIDEPLFAFGEHDSNGNQSMWSMYESNDDLSDAKNNLDLSDFPTITDEKKPLMLKEPMVICVYSPKGGVGKTSISVNLAARLSYTTKAQVCIVDLDIGFGNVGTRLGLYNPTVRELLSESSLDSESLSRNLVYDRRSGLFALLAPLRPETGTNKRKFSPSNYNKILNLLTQRFDIVILDCPVELRDPLVSGFALSNADKVVMVINNEQATLLDARRALEAMCRSKESQRLPGLGIDPKSIGLIVNQKVDNVGREVNDVMQVISGSDPNHPSKDIDLLAVIEDDRELWVGNANMARTVATSGENEVDSQLDKIWNKILPNNVLNEIETEGRTLSKGNQLDDIFSNNSDSVNNKKTKRRFSILKKWDK